MIHRPVSLIPHEEEKKMLWDVLTEAWFQVFEFMALILMSALYSFSYLYEGIEGSDDEALVAGEQDEELSRWEQEQIRKGINIPQACI